MTDEDFHTFTSYSWWKSGFFKYYLTRNGLTVRISRKEFRQLENGGTSDKMIPLIQKIWSNHATDISKDYGLIIGGRV